ncbi:hypothetical protein IC235_05130 [Hymenobacter sp. BT664]|uniref:Alpha/beta hydrolase n=1 Tax=Hymenobacter montanus TaxID=2771359 RepID=A0A927BBT1_9BACT|nr:hypothetical protein [Hymenobacter montanus]MBD2767269.1 hypothetical protein [Hymenobacter montanus]
MSALQNFPYFPIEFTKEGQVFNPAQVEALVTGLKPTAATDLLVLSHGWNNDMQDAQSLYEAFLGAFRQVLDGPVRQAFTQRKFAVLGVLWPSKKFADSQLIPSGAASASAPISNALLTAALDHLRGTFDAPGADQALEQARALVPSLEDSPKAQEKFAELLRSVLPATEASPDVDASAAFRTLPGQELMTRLAKPFPATLLPQAQTHGPAAGLGPGFVGQGAGLAQFFGGIKAGALNLLNYTTYYQMKERAGRVGRDGLYAVLQRVQQQCPLKLHLAGHSFGARLVTAAADKEGQPPLIVHTLTLLQAAFSHYGFSDNYDGTQAGFFRRVLTRHVVKGPILVSHSVRDTAVGTMYPLASMLARQVGQSLGDAHSKYGGLGRNGAQKTPESISGALLPVGASYAFRGGSIFNLNADAIIQGHSDISHPEVAYALLQAIATT